MHTERPASGPSLLRVVLRRCTRSWLWLAMALSLPLHAQTRSFSGLIYPLHDITLSAGVAGLVMKRPVVPGQSVTEGQLLVQLDDRLQTIESQRRLIILQDNSELNATRDRLQIIDTLLANSRAAFNATKSVSKDELLRLEAEQLATQGRLDQLIAQKKREALEHSFAEGERLQRQINAPISGVVTKIMPDIGEWAKAGDPVLHLVDTKVGVLRLAIPHGAANTLKLGQTHLIRLEPGSAVATVEGQVRFVSPVADPASGLVQVELRFNNPGQRIKTGIKGSIELRP